MAVVLDSSSFDVEKLTSEIFSILENNFLFGTTKTRIPPIHQHPPQYSPQHPHHVFVNNINNTKVRILSIDGGDAILAAKSLSHLESCLRRISLGPNASISDYFDVVAGSGTGGILAALLFTRGKDGRPLFTANEALSFLLQNLRKLHLGSSQGFLRRAFRPLSPGTGKGKALEKLFGRTFGECTLKDTLKSVLIPCYDVATRGAFVFSRADALEMDGYDFKMSDVCLATSADPAAEIRSVDSRTKVVALDGRIAMNNPTAVAITHVLNNKQEFPLCNGVEDLLVLSLGNGGSDFGVDNPNRSPAHFLRIAGDGASDTVDQAVSMAFGRCGANNYVRIQANGMIARESNSKNKVTRSKTTRDDDRLVGIAEEMLSQRNVESVLFKGKKIGEGTNQDKLEAMGGELIKEQERRKTSILPAVVLKQQVSIQSPTRTSSATSLSTLSSSSS